MSNIDKRAKSVIRELIADARIRRIGKLVITADEMEMLLDELEAEQRISTTWRKTAESNSEKLEVAEKRIAELEANNDSAHKALINARHRTVTMPTGYSLRPGHPINETERSVMIPKDGGQWLSRFDVEHALRVAGIRINRDE